ncbi:MAG TPA: c-type cytochrome, partial [Polyangiales bacterium]|nr:c-type cytochrome [Polyangiales bacterium]
ACEARPGPSARVGGDAARGQQLLRSFGCVACHEVPGVQQPRGRVGPGLAAFAERSYIAGVLPNTPENLVHFVVDPLAVVPNTAMPALGVSQAQAQDIAAYLYSLVR